MKPMHRAVCVRGSRDAIQGLGRAGAARWGQIRSTFAPRSTLGSSIRSGGIKQQFGFQKTRYRGLAKNGAQLNMLFALSNLWMARRRMLPSAGQVVPEMRPMAAQGAQ